MKSMYFSTMAHLHIVLVLVIATLSIVKGEPPSVYLTPADQTVAVEATLNLRCRVGNSPNLVVTWSLNGEKLGPTGNADIGVFIRPYRPSRERSDLTIAEADSTNEGHYECHAVNDDGEDSGTSHIQLEGHEIECVPADQTYCYNGGTCLMLKGSTNSQDKHCECPDDYEGTKCQTRKLDFDFSKDCLANLSKAHVGAIVGSVIAVIVLAIVVSVLLIKWNRSRSQTSEGLTMDSVHQDREKNVGITNQAAEQSDKSYILQDGGYSKDVLGD